MMKTKLFGWLLAFTLVLGLCAVPVVPAATEAASAAEGSWQVTNGTADGGLLTASGTEDMTATWSEPVDVMSGIIFTYRIEEFTLNSQIGGEESGRQMITFTFESPDGQTGIQVLIRPQRRAVDTDRLNQRMTVGINYKEDGTYLSANMWDFDTYVDIFDTDHTLSLQYSYGSYYVEADGQIFPPYRPANDFDLSQASLTLTTHSADANYPASLNFTDISFEKQVIADGDWLDMGPSEHILNPDGSVTYHNIDEQSTADYPGTNYWLHTHIGAVRGYDVSERITLQVHYNINGAGVWWGLYFCNQPFMPFDPEKTNIDYTDDMAFCKGVQFDAVAPYWARPYYMASGEDLPDEELAKRRETHPNGISVAYGGVEDLNTIEIEVGETATSIWFNGELLWDDFQLTLADFSEENGGDGKMYPLFEFIETPATPTRGIDLTIKGINVPQLTGESVYTRAIDSTEALEVGVTDPGNGALVLQDAQRNDISADLWSYENGVFTIDAEVFADLAVNETEPYTFFIANNGGRAGIQVYVLEEVAPLEAAVITPVSYTLAEVQGATEDLVLSVDFKNGTFVSFIGGGLTSSQFTVTQPEEGSTVGTITLSKTFLNNLREGQTTVRLTTTDVTGATAVTEFVITVGRTEEDPGTGGGCGGCGGLIGTGLALPAVLALGGAAILIKKKHN